MSRKFYDVWVLITRLSIGFMFANSGWGKLSHLQSFIDNFSEWGVFSPTITGPTTAGVELVFGSLLIVGAATRTSAVMLLVTMIGASYLVHIPNIWSETSTISGFFSNYFYTSEWLLIVVLGIIIVNGPGRPSVDYLFSSLHRRKEHQHQ